MLFGPNPLSCPQSRFLTVGGARIAWDLWRVLFVNDGNFSKRMQDIIGQAGSGAVGGAGSIEATQLGPAASGARVSESDGVT